MSYTSTKHCKTIENNGAVNNVNTNSDGNEIEPATEVTALTQEQVDSRNKAHMATIKQQLAHLTKLIHSFASK